MALVIDFKKGEHIHIDDIDMTLVGSDKDGCTVNLTENGTTRELYLPKREMIEIRQDVFIACGDRIKPKRVSITIKAPRRIKIMRSKW